MNKKTITMAVLTLGAGLCLMCCAKAGDAPAPSSGVVGATVRIPIVSSSTAVKSNTPPNVISIPRIGAKTK